MHGGRGVFHVPLSARRKQHAAGAVEACGERRGPITALHMAAEAPPLIQRVGRINTTSIAVCHTPDALFKHGIAPALVAHYAVI